MQNSRVDTHSHTLRNDRTYWIVRVIILVCLIVVAIVWLPEVAIYALAGWTLGSMDEWLTDKIMKGSV